MDDLSDLTRASFTVKYLVIGRNTSKAAIRISWSAYFYGVRFYWIWHRVKI